MVFGGVGKERIQLNEDTICSAGNDGAIPAGAYKQLSEIRRLLFDGKYVCDSKRLRGGKKNIESVQAIS